MFKTIVLGDKEIGLVANAATIFRFKQVFGKDLLGILGNEQRAETEGVEAVTELAYIMAKAAEKADMNKLNYDEFIKWLEDFEPMAFVEAAEDILSVYMESSKATATP